MYWVLSNQSVQDKVSRLYPEPTILNFSVLFAFNLFDHVHSYHDDFLTRLFITGQAIPQDVEPFKEDSHAKFTRLLPPKDRLEIIHHFMPVCCINAWNAKNKNLGLDFMKFLLIYQFLIQKMNLQLVQMELFLVV